MTREKPYSFWPSEAEKYGIEKAVILYNLRHWLSVNKAAAKPMHFHDGMWWTYNTAKAFENLMPFFNRRSISRWMNELESAGVVKSGVFNAAGYDRTKWYTIPAEFTDSAIGQNDQAIGQNDQAIGQNDSPIPVVNPDGNPDVNLSSVPPAGGTCDVCNGFGRIWHDTWWDTCNKCNGTGKTPLHPDQPTPKQDKAEKPKRKTKAEKLFDLVRSKQFVLSNASDDVLLEWCRLRARKGASDSDLVHNRIDAQLQILINHGMTIDDALTEQVARNWTDLKAEWFDVMKGRLPNQQEWGQQTQSGWSAGLESEVYKGNK